ncbi:hypothetical protein RRG08_039636 [Elysia crispata]|uniref:Uncharacterized protein n=1 Tax=Elysia crispata TaxID=231223 RepID=A0AAE0YAP5_9GAST|nr:hypothetical protein RRG08_039636 [Elysia crispata]
METKVICVDKQDIRSARIINSILRLCPQIILESFSDRCFVTEDCSDRRQHSIFPKEALDRLPQLASCLPLFNLIRLMFS